MGVPRLWVKLVLLICVAVSSDAHTNAQSIIHVDDDASLGGDGTNWTAAYRHLQDALTIAKDGDVIRVAQGIYYPDRDEAGNVIPGDREATFQLVNGVAVMGGYWGCPGGECGDDSNERDIEVYTCVLSGDLAGDDYVRRLPEHVLDNPTRSENCYHVVIGSGTDETSVLDGFTVTGGNADGLHASSRGGGMYNSYGSPRLTNCTFSGNSAEYGGGICNDWRSSPTFLTCTIFGNVADHGGGMCNRLYGRPTLTNCAFSRNLAAYFGGGMHNDESSPMLANSTFSDNSATFVGGGMSNDDCSPVLANCTFSGNSADSRGGGMVNWYKCSPTLTECSFVGNQAGHSGGGIHNRSNSSPTLTTCAFSGNLGGFLGGAMYNEFSSNPILKDCRFSENSATYGGGMGNRSSNPTLAKCMFSRNTATYGGGMYNWNSSSPTLTDCTFLGNSAWEAGGIHNDFIANLTLTNCVFSANSAATYGGGLVNLYSDLILTNCTFSGNRAELGGAGIRNFGNNSTLTNCILWDGGDEIWNGDDSTIEVSYSSVQDEDAGDDTVYPGEGNIDDDPLFVPGPAGCYYLSQTAAGQADQSLCVDAGSDTAVNMGLYSLTTRSDEGVDIGIVDMGYHYPATGNSLIMGDYNRNGTVDLLDLAGLQRCFAGPGSTGVPPCCRIFDFDENNTVDLSDVPLLQRVLSGP